MYVVLDRAYPAQVNSASTYKSEIDHHPKLAPIVLKSVFTWKLCRNWKGNVDTIFRNSKKIQGERWRVVDQ